MHNDAGRVVLALTLTLLLGSLSHAAVAEKLPFRIEAQRASTALVEFGRQARREILFGYDRVKDIQTNAVSGNYEPVDALRLLVKGTGLVVVEKVGGVLVVEPVGGGVGGGESYGRARMSANVAAEQLAENTSLGTQASSRVEEEGERRSEEPETVQGIPEILVRGSKVLNMDIPRSRDGTLPYVVLDKATIERSGATNIGDFLKQRLPMNTASATQGQSAASGGNLSSISLRGLGENQTLVLIDGHRVSSLSNGSIASQSNLNAIPLGAIERIEVLPTTAGGIYGGSATGGAINIILRRNYSGLESKLTYDGTFQGDSPGRRIDITGGVDLERGKTSILFALSHADQDSLLSKERRFAEDGRLAILANNPNFFLPPNNPPIGPSANIRSHTTVGGVFQDLTLDDGTPLNSTVTHAPVGYGGAALGDTTALVSNAGRYNLALANSADFVGGNGGRALLQAYRVDYATVTLRREITSSLQGFMELAGSRQVNRTTYGTWSLLIGNTFILPANAPNNPFQQAIAVSIPYRVNGVDIDKPLDDYRGVAGLVLKLSRGWAVEADYTWQKYKLGTPQSSPILSAQARTAITNGSIDILRDPSSYDLTPFLSFGNSPTPVHSNFKDVTIRASGPWIRLPAGDVTLSGMIETRNMDLGRATNPLPVVSTTTYYPARSQSVDSAYFEARFPLVGKANASRGLRELELQLAARHDRYTTRTSGGTVSQSASLPPPPDSPSSNMVTSSNPTIGLRYKPVASLTFRATYSSGFVPPGVDQLSGGTTVTPAGGTIIDPRRGGSAYQFVGTSMFGGNPDLKPEQSTSWSVGVIATPQAVPGLRASVDYTRITKTDNIDQLSVQQLITNEGLFPEQVQRGANLPGDLPGWAGPIVFYDIRLRNFARAEVAAYDVQMDYSLPVRSGSLSLFAIATWQTDYRKQFLPTLSPVDSVGITSANPLRVKANAGVAWSDRNWSMGWVARHFDSYVVSETPLLVLNQGSLRVSGQTYHDMYADYTFDGKPGSRASNLLDGVKLQLGVRNVFDKKPSFDAAASSFDYYSPYGDPRLASYHVSLTKTF